MPHTFTTTGGARVGWTNATWPLAQLSATSDKLTISIRLLGTYSFAPDQVSVVERYVMIPVLGWGIRVHHCNPDCPKRVIFWCLGSPEAVLEGIQGSGFLPIASSSSFPERHGMAMRWSAIIIAVVVWNALRQGYATFWPPPYASRPRSHTRGHQGGVGLSQLAGWASNRCRPVCEGQTRTCQTIQDLPANLHQGEGRVYLAHGLAKHMEGVPPNRWSQSGGSTLVCA